MYSTRSETKIYNRLKNRNNWRKKGRRIGMEIMGNKRSASRWNDAKKKDRKRECCSLAEFVTMERYIIPLRTPEIAATASSSFTCHICHEDRVESAKWFTVVSDRHKSTNESSPSVKINPPCELNAKRWVNYRYRCKLTQRVSNER